MAMARSSSLPRPSAEMSEPDTAAWRLPMNTLRPRSRASSRSTSSSLPSLTPTDRDRRSPTTASAASAPALRAPRTRSCNKFSSMAPYGGGWGRPARRLASKERRRRTAKRGATDRAPRGLCEQGAGSVGVDGHHVVVVVHHHPLVVEAGPVVLGIALHVAPLDV